MFCKFSVFIVECLVRRSKQCLHNRFGFWTDLNYFQKLIICTAINVLEKEFRLTRRYHMRSINSYEM